MAHDAAHFRRPREFIPERWLDPESKDIKEASQPFSVGPRGCLGRKYVRGHIDFPLMLETRLK